jgi:hypothetical protein
MSTNGCNADLGNFVTDSGIPRYLIKNDTIWHGNSATATTKCSSSQRIGSILHLSRLQARPDASSNSDKMERVSCKSLADGEMNKIKSSMYNEAHSGIAHSPSGCHNDHESVL